MTPRQQKINEIINTYLYFRKKDLGLTFTNEQIEELKKIVIYEVEGCTLFSLEFCRGLTRAVEKFQTEITNEQDTK